MNEKPHIDVIRRTPGYGPQGFIKDLDRHAKTKIAHNIAFHVYGFENFEHLWSREWVVEEPELNLATRWLQKDVHSTRSRTRAGAMIRVWWFLHNIEGDEFTLLEALDKAWESTQHFRDFHESRREEEKAVMGPDFIRAYLEKHATGTAAEIARATGLERKAVNQALRRMCQSGEVIKVSRGVYQLRGDKWWL
jgi:hypothetical protein